MSDTLLYKNKIWQQIDAERENMLHRIQGRYSSRASV